MSCPHCFIAVLLLCDLDLTCLPETKLFQSPSNFLSNCPIKHTPEKKNLEGVLEAVNKKVIQSKTSVELPGPDVDMLHKHSGHCYSTELTGGLSCFKS